MSGCGGHVRGWNTSLSGSGSHLHSRQVPAGQSPRPSARKPALSPRRGEGAVALGGPRAAADRPRGGAAARSPASFRARLRLGERGRGSAPRPPPWRGRPCPQTARPGVASVSAPGAAAPPLLAGGPTVAASLLLGTFLGSSGLILAVAAFFYLKRSSALAWLCHGTDKGTPSGRRGHPTQRLAPGCGGSRAEGGPDAGRPAAKRP